MRRSGAGPVYAQSVIVVVVVVDMASHVIKNVGGGARETARKRRGRRVYESYTQLHMVFIDLKL